MSIVRMCLSFFIWFSVMGAAFAAGPNATDGPPGCFSCQIKVDSLSEPMKLSGKWLFTRDDLPENKEVGADTSTWKLVKAPGPWKGVYDDKKVYSVGWYRGVFDFNPGLVGQEAVLLVNAYMGRVSVYVDGQIVYARPGNINIERYYSIQAIPIRFKIAPHQVVAIRVESPLMAGIYQLPLELRKYDKHDAGLVGYQLFGGESRLIAAYVVLFFGLFFLLVYAKTRYGLYMTCSAFSLMIFPFFAAPNDYFLSIFEPETMLYLHYTGMMAMPVAYLFSQYFHKFTPKINWIGGAMIAAMGLTIGSMAWHPNIELFQHIRSVFFLSIQMSGIGACYMFARGVQNKKPGAPILLIGMTIFLGFGTNDVLLALGLISSYSMIFYGVLVGTGSMLYVASSSFANTFVENKKLVSDLKVMNDGLEELVAERTVQLQQKTNDIEAMLGNMPQGVLTMLPGSLIHPEYSAYLETIFETKEIAGKSLQSMAFADSNLGSDALSQVDAAISSCLGGDEMNFQFNSHLLPLEIQKKMPDGRVKVLEMSWSPICGEGDLVDKLMVCVRDVTEFKRLAGEAGAQKRELEIIGEILSVSQEKFQDFLETSYIFINENDSITRSSTQKDAGEIGVLFRNMHTVKGNARTYGLLHLTNVVHELEQFYDELRNNPDKDWPQESQLHQLAQVRALIDEYAKVNNTTLGRKGPGRRGDAERFLMVERKHVEASVDVIDAVDPKSLESLRAALETVGQTLRRVGTEKMSDVLAGVVDSMPSLAKELSKEAPSIVIVDHDIRVKTQASNLLKNVFVHLFRNSMDHGIESPAERVAAGKNSQGKIQLELGLDHECLTMSIKDDGRGINIAKIRSVALEKGLLSSSSASASEVAQAIFASGFSTAEKITEVSGRGVGMDAVKAFLEQEGGSVEVKFLGGDEHSELRAFEMVIRLPKKFATS